MSSPESSKVRRTLALVVIAFVLSFLAVAVGVGQGRFLVSAYHHGGL